MFVIPFFKKNLFSVMIDLCCENNDIYLFGVAYFLSTVF